MPVGQFAAIVGAETANREIEQMAVGPSARRSLDAMATAVMIGQGLRTPPSAMRV